MRVKTIIDASKLSSGEYERLMKALEYCRVNDKYGSFTYRIRGGKVEVYSPSLDIARRRGSYLKKKFKLSYRIIVEEDG